MSEVGKTNISEIKYLYDSTLGIILNLPNLSIAIKSIFNKNLTRSQKLPIILLSLASCGSTIYSKKTIPVTLVLNIINIVYYRTLILKTKDDNHVHVYLNTLLTMSILLCILYTAQLCLRSK